MLQIRVCYIPWKYSILSFLLCTSCSASASLDTLWVIDLKKTLSRRNHMESPFIVPSITTTVRLRISATSSKPQVQVGGGSTGPPWMLGSLFFQCDTCHSPQCLPLLILTHDSIALLLMLMASLPTPLQVPVQLMHEKAGSWARARSWRP